MVERVKVTGLREFQAQLRAMDATLPRQLRLALNEAAGLVVRYGAQRMPHRTGRAAGSLRAQSSQRYARVALGGRRAPYAAWLDRGGKGRKPGRPAMRPYVKGGRYVYPGFDANRDEITTVMSGALVQLARNAGFEVD